MSKEVVPQVLLDITKDAIYFGEGADFEFVELVNESKRWAQLKELYQKRFPSAFLTGDDVDAEKEQSKLYSAIKEDICKLLDSLRPALEVKPKQPCDNPV